MPICLPEITGFLQNLRTSNVIYLTHSSTEIMLKSLELKSFGKVFLTISKNIFQARKNYDKSGGKTNHYGQLLFKSEVTTSEQV